MVDLWQLSAPRSNTCREIHRRTQIRTKNTLSTVVNRAGVGPTRSTISFLQEKLLSKKHPHSYDTPVARRPHQPGLTTVYTPSEPNVGVKR